MLQFQLQGLLIIRPVGFQRFYGSTILSLTLFIFIIAKHPHTINYVIKCNNSAYILIIDSHQLVCCVSMSLKCENNKEVKFFCRFPQCSQSCAKCYNCQKCESKHQNCAFQEKSITIIEKTKSFENSKAINQNKDVITQVKELQSKCNEVVKSLEKNKLTTFGYPSSIKVFSPEDLKYKKGKELNQFLNQKVYTFNNYIEEAVFQQISHLKQLLIKLNLNLRQLYAIDEEISKVKFKHKIFQDQSVKKDERDILPLRQKFVEETQRIILRLINQRNKLELSQTAKKNIKAIKQIQQIYQKEVWSSIINGFSIQNYKLVRQNIKRYESMCNQNIFGQYSLVISQQKTLQLIRIQFKMAKQQGDIKTAITQLQKLPIQTANDLQLLYDLLVQNKQQQKADQILMKSTQMFPQSSYFLLKKSQKYQKEKDFQKSYTYLKQYVQTQNLKDPSYYQKLGNMAFRNGNIKETVQWFQQYVASQGQNTQNLELLSNIYLSLNKNELAIGILQKILNLLNKSNKPTELQMKIRCLNNLSNISSNEQKQQLLNDSISLSNQYNIFNYNAHFQLTKLYLRQQKFQRLFEEIDIAQSIYPYAQFYFEKGRIISQNCKLNNKQEIVKAKDLFTLAINLQKQNMQAIFLRGKCHFWLGAYNESLSDFNKVKSCINSNTNNKMLPELSFRIGKSLQELGKLQQGEQAYKQSLGLQNQNKNSQYGLACVLKKQKKIDEALKLLNILVDDQKYGVLALQQIGNIHQESLQSIQSIKKKHEKLSLALSFYQKAYNLEKNQNTKKNYVRCLQRLRQDYKIRQIESL